MKFPTQHGSVLIVVLWACLGLVSVALLFGHAMLLNYRGSGNDVAGQQADEAIEGAARYVEAVLAQVPTPGQFPDPATYEKEGVKIGDATFWIIGRASDTTSIAATTPTYGLVDEASKINLNNTTPAALQGLPGVTLEFAGAIIDWRDPDEVNLLTGGPESTAYLLHQPPYASKNAPFESVEELALVDGATSEILYGEDANLNGVLDANEDDADKNAPADNADGKLDGGMLDDVTCFSREPNTRADGTQRINVSQPTMEFATLLETTFGAARFDEIRQRLLASPQRQSVLEIYVRSGMTPEEFAQIEDAITTNNGDYVIGRVNVNTASETVLAGIPGIGADSAAALVAARTARAQQDTNITWIVETLGAARAIAAGPFVTARSYQVSADVAAVGRNGRGYRRTRFVIDNSTGTPRIIYRRNLAQLGWALGGEVRQSLAAGKESR